MSEIRQWVEHQRGSADELLIGVRFLGDDRHTVHEDWLIAASGVYQLDQNDLLAALEELGTHEGGPRYAVTVRETHMSWGADANALSILLDTAENLATVAAWEGMLGIGRMVRTYMTEHSEPVFLTDAEIERRATWAICLRYEDVASDDLRVRSVTSGSDVGSCVLFDQRTGRTYDVDLTVVGGVVVVSKVRWLDA